MSNWIDADQPARNSGPCCAESDLRVRKPCPDGKQNGAQRQSMRAIRRSPSNAMQWLDHLANLRHPGRAIDTDGIGEMESKESSQLPPKNLTTRTKPSALDLAAPYRSTSSVLGRHAEVCSLAPECEGLSREQIPLESGQTSVTRHILPKVAALSSVWESFFLDAGRAALAQRLPFHPDFPAPALANAPLAIAGW